MKLEEKIIKLQAKITDIKKDAKNNFQNFNYLSLPKIMGKLKPALEELGLYITYKQDKETISVKPYNYNNKQGQAKLGWYSVAFMEVAIGDESGEKVIASSIISGENDDPAKAVGSMLTYGRRYLLEQLLNITGDIKLDPDSKATSKQAPQSVATPQVDKEQLIKEIRTLKPDLEEKNGLDLNSMEVPALQRVLDKIKGVK